MADQGTIDNGGAIEPIELDRALEERYLAYALSTIMHRALPDVRDGLKPVHRRVVFAMRQLRLDPGSGFKKCARVVGDVIGKFHPHGDQSVYDALVRLAQDFAQRYPLVDGQGNFGNVDGDNAAAMRYTEARLTDVAALLLEGIDEDAVDFRDTYDGSEREPVVLPANFPNILANGSSGIAVGMATAIPPHNAAELCEAALRLIETPDLSIDELVALVPGPDLPTGGVLVESPAAIREAYRTGRGSFRLRARWAKEDQGRGAWVIAVTEVPYQVPKARLVEQIAGLLENKRLPLLGDVRDESAEDVRLVLEPKSRAVDPDLVMEQLFRLTDLEIRLPLNMNVLARGRVPMVLGLGAVLQHWLDHRKDVLGRRSRHRLAEIARRLEVLSGYLVAYLNLDEVIRIIRYEDEPKAELIRAFGLTDIQAEAILNMRLRALRRLEEMEIRREHEKLSKEQAKLDRLLASEKRQWQAVADQIRAVRDQFGPETALGRRRTGFGEAKDLSGDLGQTLIEKEPLTVVLSQKGWIRALRGHVADLSALAFKGDDRLDLALHAESTDRIVLVSTDGRAFTLDAAKLPGGRGFGEPLKLMVELGESEAIVAAFRHRPEGRRLMVSTEGRGFLVNEQDLIATTRKGRQVMTVDPPFEVKLCLPADGDAVAVIGGNRKLLTFALSQVAEMPRGKGVRLQRYKDGGFSDAKVFTRARGLTWVDASGNERMVASLDEYWADRAQAGRLAPRGFPRSNRFDDRAAAVIGLNGSRVGGEPPK